MELQIGQLTIVPFFPASVEVKKFELGKAAIAWKSCCVTAATATSPKISILSPKRSGLKKCISILALKRL